MKCDAKLLNRVKRVQGQTSGIISMMENEASCEALITQLKAVRSSVDKIISILLTNNLIDSIQQNNNIELDNIEEAVELLIKHK